MKALVQEFSDISNVPYAIYDLSGKIAFESTIQRSREIIDISGLKKGFYILKIILRSLFGKK